MIEIDEDSFTDTAAAIWNLNKHARETHSAVSYLRTWMVAQSMAAGDSSFGWGTLGFWISLDGARGGRRAKASVEAWFVLQSLRDGRI
jgi:hypothetical protein